MLKICLVFWKSEPQYAYKRYAYKKKHVYQLLFYGITDPLLFIKTIWWLTTLFK